MSKVICYYDFEATSVSRDSDPISLGIIAVQNNKVLKSIYCEFTDFNLDKCDDWVKENIVGKLQLDWLASWWSTDWTDAAPETKCKGTKSEISEYIKQWLSQFESVEFWADFDVIDKPMLIDLIADWKKTNLNEYTFLSYEEKIKLKYFPCRYDQFFDLHTLLKLKGIDTDINREEFIGDLIKEIPEGQSHNALYDSYINWKLHQKLMSL